MSIIILILLNALIFVVVENSKVCLRLPCKEKECEVITCPECEKTECPEVEEKECPEIKVPTCPEENVVPITGNAAAELVCNKPYIRNEYECCLDKNDNSICDEDEYVVSPPKETKQSKLRDAAEFYAKNFINESYDQIYSLLTEDAKAIMSESDFENLFAAVIYGISSSLPDEGQVSWRIEKQPYKTMYVDRVFTINGTIDYSVRNQDDLINYSTESFIYEDDDWKITSINYLPYAGCEKVKDCSDKGDILTPLCQNVCKNFRNTLFRAEKTFDCRENICHCNCWSEVNQYYTSIRPSNNYINEFSLNK